MSRNIKSKIFKLLDDIEDETVLNQVMEDVTFYASKKDIMDELSADQLKSLDEAIQETDNKDTLTWDELKREMDEWKSK